jgi:hypothetical protein
MSRFSPQAPWEFLRTASRPTLQSYELSRLAHAANLRKELVQILDQLVEERTSAGVARCLLEEQEHAVVPVDRSAPAGADVARPSGHTASDNISAESTSLHRGLRLHL